jgi:c-di-GMP-binding flagellar brake protein YcgR
MVAEERRKYPRLDLTVEDGYFGNFKLVDEKLVASIVNLSPNGFNIELPQSAKSKIKEGATISLLNIAGAASLNFLNQVQAEIIWIKNLNTPGYVSVGCKFLDLAETVHRQIIQFVDSERLARGQYS